MTAASPSMFVSDDEEEVFSKSSDTMGELKLLEKLNTLLSGIPPPPSLATCRLSHREMLERIKANEDLLVLPPAKNPMPETNPKVYYLNKGAISEEIASLMLKTQERYVQCETLSTCTAWFQSALPLTASAKKRQGWQGISPGRRLSHLARRRQVFSRAHLQQLSKNDTNNHRLAIKATVSSQRLKNFIESRKVQQPALPKRALFQSPEEEPVRPGFRTVVKHVPRRKLFGSGDDKGQPQQPPIGNGRYDVSGWIATQNFNGGRKRLRSEARESDNKRRCPRRSLDFSDSSPSRCSEVSTQYSASQPPISTIHKQKLLWAVSFALKERKITHKDKLFKPCATVLFNVCKRNLAIIRNLPTPGGTSEKMLQFARQEAPAVIAREERKSGVLKEVSDSALNSLRNDPNMHQFSGCKENVSVHVTPKKSGMTRLWKSCLKSQRKLKRSLKRAKSCECIFSDSKKGGDAACEVKRLDDCRHSVVLNHIVRKLHVEENLLDHTTNVCGDYNVRISDNLLSNQAVIGTKPTVQVGSRNSIGEVLGKTKNELLPASDHSVNELLKVTTPEKIKKSNQTLVAEDVTTDNTDNIKVCIATLSNEKVPSAETPVLGMSPSGEGCDGIFSGSMEDDQVLQFPALLAKKELIADLGCQIGIDNIQEGNNALKGAFPTQAAASSPSCKIFGLPFVAAKRKLSLPPVGNDSDSVRYAEENDVDEDFVDGGRHLKACGDVVVPDSSLEICEIVGNFSLEALFVSTEMEPLDLSINHNRVLSDEEKVENNPLDLSLHPKSNEIVPDIFKSVACGREMGEIQKSERNYDQCEPKKSDNANPIMVCALKAIENCSEERERHKFDSVAAKDADEVDSKSDEEEIRVGKEELENVKGSVGVVSERGDIEPTTMDHIDFMKPGLQEEQNSLNGMCTSTPIQLVVKTRRAWKAEPGPGLTVRLRLSKEWGIEGRVTPADTSGSTEHSSRDDSRINEIEESNVSSKNVNTSEGTETTRAETSTESYCLIEIRDRMAIEKTLKDEPSDESAVATSYFLSKSSDFSGATEQSSISDVGIGMGILNGMVECGNTLDGRHELETSMEKNLTQDLSFKNELALAVCGSVCENQRQSSRAEEGSKPYFRACEIKKTVSNENFMRSSKNSSSVEVMSEPASKIMSKAVLPFDSVSVATEKQDEETLRNDESTVALDGSICEIEQQSNLNGRTDVQGRRRRCNLRPCEKKGKTFNEKLEGVSKLLALDGITNEPSREHPQLSFSSNSSSSVVTSKGNKKKKNSTNKGSAVVVDDSVGKKNEVESVKCESIDCSEAGDGRRLYKLRSCEKKGKTFNEELEGVSELLAFDGIMNEPSSEHPELSFSSSSVAIKRKKKKKNSTNEGFTVVVDDSVRKENEVESVECESIDCIQAGDGRRLYKLRSCEKKSKTFNEELRGVSELLAFDGIMNEPSSEQPELSFSSSSVVTKGKRKKKNSTNEGSTVLVDDSVRKENEVESVKCESIDCIQAGDGRRLYKLRSCEKKSKTFNEELEGVSELLAFDGIMNEPSSEHPELSFSSSSVVTKGKRKKKNSTNEGSTVLVDDSVRKENEMESVKCESIDCSEADAGRRLYKLRSCDQERSLRIPKSKSCKKGTAERTAELANRAKTFDSVYVLNKTPSFTGRVKGVQSKDNRTHAPISECSSEDDDLPLITLSAKKKRRKNLTFSAIPSSNIDDSTDYYLPLRKLEGFAGSTRSEEKEVQTKNNSVQSLPEKEEFLISKDAAINLLNNSVEDPLSDSTELMKETNLTSGTTKSSDSSIGEDLPLRVLVNSCTDIGVAFGAGETCQTSVEDSAEKYDYFHSASASIKNETDDLLSKETLVDCDKFVDCRNYLVGSSNCKGSCVKAKCSDLEDEEMDDSDSSDEDVPLSNLLSFPHCSSSVDSSNNNKIVSSSNLDKDVTLNQLMTSRKGKDSVDIVTNVVKETDGFSEGLVSKQKPLSSSSEEATRDSDSSDQANLPPRHQNPSNTTETPFNTTILRNTSLIEHEENEMLVKNFPKPEVDCSSSDSDSSSDEDLALKQLIISPKPKDSIDIVTNMAKETRRFNEGSFSKQEPLPSSSEEATSDSDSSDQLNLSPCRQNPGNPTLINHEKKKIVVKNSPKEEIDWSSSDSDSSSDEDLPLNQLITSPKPKDPIDIVANVAKETQESTESLFLKHKQLSSTIEEETSGSDSFVDESVFLGCQSSRQAVTKKYTENKKLVENSLQQKFDYSSSDSDSSDDEDLLLIQMITSRKWKDSMDIVTNMAKETQEFTESSVSKHEQLSSTIEEETSGSDSFIDESVFLRCESSLQAATMKHVENEELVKNIPQQKVDSSSSDSDSSVDKDFALNQLITSQNCKDSVDVLTNMTKETQGLSEGSLLKQEPLPLASEEATSNADSFIDSVLLRSKSSIHNMTVEHVENELSSKNLLEEKAFSNSALEANLVSLECNISVGNALKIRQEMENCSIRKIQSFQTSLSQLADGEINDVQYGSSGEAIPSAQFIGSSDSKNPGSEVLNPGGDRIESTEDESTLSSYSNEKTCSVDENLPLFQLFKSSNFQSTTPKPTKSSVGLDDNSAFSELLIDRNHSTVRQRVYHSFISDNQIDMPFTFEAGSCNKKIAYLDLERCEKETPEVADGYSNESSADSATTQVIDTSNDTSSNQCIERESLLSFSPAADANNVDNCSENRFGVVSEKNKGVMGDVTPSSSCHSDARSERSSVNSSEKRQKLSLESYKARKKLESLYQEENKLREHGEPKKIYNIKLKHPLRSNMKKRKQRNLSSLHCETDEKNDEQDGFYDFEDNSNSFDPRRSRNGSNRVSCDKNSEIGTYGTSKWLVENFQENADDGHTKVNVTQAKETALEVNSDHAKSRSIEYIEEKLRSVIRDCSVNGNTASHARDASKLRPFLGDQDPKDLSDFFLKKTVDVLVALNTLSKVVEEQIQCEFTLNNDENERRQELNRLARVHREIFRLKRLVERNPQSLLFSAFHANKS